MDEKKQISVRINGKDKPVRTSVNEETPAREKKSFNWILPEAQSSTRKVALTNDKRKKHSPRLPLSRKRSFHPFEKRRNRMRNGLKKEWLSAISAVVVGLVMGFIVLSVFTDHHVQQMTTTESESSEMKDTGTNGGTPASASLDATWHLVQGAAFADKNNAQNVADRLKEKGYPAVLNKDEDNVFMYIGLAVNESGADQLGALYQQNGQDVYVKPFQVKVDEKNIEEKTRARFSDVKTLLEVLTAGTVRGLTTDDAVFSDEEWRKAEETYRQVQKGDEQSEFQSLMKPLHTAMENVKTYRQQQDENSLWRAQEALLEAVRHYRELVQHKG